MLKRIDFPETIKKITTKLALAGGKSYLVGGATIDIITGKEPKDWDIEVFNISYQAIINQLETIPNIKLDLIGNKFGVVKIKYKGLDIEITIPRRDNKTGPKHTDFDIQLVPNLSIEEAAKRRDITINSMYFDLNNNILHDPYDGLADYKRGVIRAVSSETFVDDPLRAFRVMQLVARKGDFVAPGTIVLCSQMKEECSQLSGDSIYGEFVKLLMKSKFPSKGLVFLKDSNLIELFPELKNLIGCEQRDKWHPEGDAFIHTLMVIDEAAKYRDELPEEWKLSFMWGMLLHDIGKPIATHMDEEKGHLTSIDHDRLGEPLARTFMERLTNNEDLIEKVSSIVKVHMRSRLLLKSSPRRATWRRLQNICPLNILAYVSMADEDGRGDPNEILGKTDPVFIKTMEVYEELGQPSSTIEPILMGRHLIATGLRPGPKFGPMLAKAYEYQLETGCTDINILTKEAINEK